MKSYNIIIFLDITYTIVDIFQSKIANRSNVDAKFIGKHISSFINIDTDKKEGRTLFNNLPVKYSILENANKAGFIVHISNGEYQSIFYKKILDILDIGIHITDSSGYMNFTNLAAERGEFLNRNLTTGKHITDVYTLTSENSTILRTLRDRKELLNIYDTFVNNYSDKPISSVNSGYPIFVDDIMVGCLGVALFNNYLDNACKKLDSLNLFVKQNKSHNQQLTSNLYYKFEDLIGSDNDYIESINLAKKIAKTDSSVLLYGETGTGKELFAQSIHNASNRNNKEFIAINCAAIPDGLVESILFGTEKGSFTGSTNKSGLLEKANNGTLFLDEINSMNITTQSKLLRVLQEKTYMKVGGTKKIPCDVRVISSTNESPENLLKFGKIRSDLYYRINTITISIPPLRDRKKDILILYNYFIKKLSYSSNFNTSKTVIDILNSYDWPGNIRELLHTVEYAISVCEDNYITTRDIPQNIIKYNTTSKPDIYPKDSNETSTLIDQMSNYEKHIIQNTLKKHNFNITQTAKELGLFRQGLQYRLKKHCLLDWISQQTNQ